MLVKSNDGPSVVFNPSVWNRLFEVWMIYIQQLLMKPGELDWIGMPEVGTRNGYSKLGGGAVAAIVWAGLEMPEVGGDFGCCQCRNESWK